MAAVEVVVVVLVVCSIAHLRLFLKLGLERERYVYKQYKVYTMFFWYKVIADCSK